MHRRLIPASAHLSALLACAALGACGGDEQPTDAPPDDAVASCQPREADASDGEGPLPLLSLPAFAERPAGLGIDPASMVQQTVDVNGQTVLLIDFDVTTFEARFGRDWVHPVTIVAPLPDALAFTDAAAFSAGHGTSNPIGPSGPDPVWGTDLPPWFAGTDTSINYLTSYASVVVSHSIPFVVTNIVPAEIELDPTLLASMQAAFAADDDPCNDQSCAGVITKDADKTGCLRAATWVSGDLSNDPTLNFAVAEMRILDAAERVLQEVYAALGSTTEVHWTRVWATGSSKRGNAQRIALALDPRIQGAQISAADVSNFPAFMDLQLAVWKGSYTFGAQYAGDMFTTAIGEAWLQAFDSFRWQPSVLAGKRYVLAVGTNDPLYPLGASLNYLKALPQDTRVHLVPGYAHGNGAVDHVAALRGLVAQGLDGTSWPQIEATWDGDSGVVTAEVSGGHVERVQLWCATDLGPANPAVQQVQPDCSTAQMTPVDGPDLRHAAWSSVPMTAIDDHRYQAEAPSSALSFPACVVWAATADGIPVTTPPLLSQPLCERSGLPWPGRTKAQNERSSQ